jgi:putative membrane protein
MALARARFRPALIITYLGRWNAARREEGLYGEITAAAIDANFKLISDVLGGCERISFTPFRTPTPS